MRTVFVGYDLKEDEAFTICSFSIMRRTTIPIEIRPLKLGTLQFCNLYTRPTTRRDKHILWDDISNAPMGTEYANSRFLVPFLKTDAQWSLYMDCDILCTEDIGSLFDLVNDDFAVMCVKHNVRLPGRTMKRDGQIQMGYHRKYWSSVMLINHEHEAWKRVSIKDINKMDGKDLHRFSWINDDEIGSIPVKWNYLVGISKGQVKGIPSFIHFTNGGPWYPEYREVKFGNLWEQERDIYNTFNKVRVPKPPELRR